MDVNFWKRSDFQKPHNSTKTPNGLLDAFGIPCTLKQPTSITAPTILLEHTEGSGWQAPYEYSYAWIPQFSRYYFVTDIVSRPGGIWEISLSVDVLGSYKNEIKTQWPYILRNSNTFDPYIVDTLTPVKTNAVSTSAADLNSPFVFDLDAGYYCLGVASGKDGLGNSGGGAITYYLLGADAYRAIMSNIFNVDGYYASITTQEISKDLLKVLYNPMQYLVSCKWFPFAQLPASATAATQFNVGYWGFGVTSGSGTGLIAYLADDSYVRLYGAITLNGHPQAGTDRLFLNYPPYLTMRLHVPPFGVIALDSPAFIDRGGAWYEINVDIITGMGHLLLYAGTGPDNSVFIAKYDSRVAVDIPMIGSGYDISDWKQVLAGGALAQAGEIFSLRSEVGNIGQGLIASGIETTILGSAGDATTYIDPPSLTAVAKMVGDIDATHQGRPLCQVKTLSTLSGYTLCQESDFCAQTVEETNEINRLLTSGFYAEW